MLLIFYIHFEEQLPSFYTHSISLHNSKRWSRKSVVHGTDTENCTSTTTLLYEQTIDSTNNDNTDYKAKEKKLCYLLVFISIAEVRPTVTYMVLHPCAH